MVMSKLAEVRGSRLVMYVLISSIYSLFCRPLNLNLLVSPAIHSSMRMRVLPLARLGLGEAGQDASSEIICMQAIMKHYSK